MIRFLIGIAPLLLPILSWALYIPDSYQQARSEFRSRLKKYDNTSLYFIKVPSQFDHDLTVDLAHLHSKRKKNLIVITTGVHGPEAYLGSMAMMLFLDDYLAQFNREDTSFVLIHALNPYGYKYNRRVTEQNIDLNRNWGLSLDLFERQNEQYGKIYDVLEPQQKVKNLFLSRLWRNKNFIQTIFTRGLDIDDYREALAFGQYDHPTGLYYGGQAYEPQVLELRRLLAPILNQYNKVMHVDFHTGLGDKGQLHIITSQRSALINYVFPMKGEKYYQVTKATSPSFFPTSGDIIDFIPQLAPDAINVAVTAEYGTMGMSPLKQWASLHRMVIENQGHHHGYDDQKLRLKVKKEFKELFFPNQQSWREKVEFKTRKMFEDNFWRFINL